MSAEATRLTRISPSPSTVAAAKARELRESGVEVLDLTVGEPDFDTPDNVKAAGIAAIERGDTKYTAVNGTPALRAKASKLTGRAGTADSRAVSPSGAVTIASSIGPPHPKGVGAGTERLSGFRWNAGTVPSFRYCP